MRSVPINASWLGILMLLASLLSTCSSAEQVDRKEFPPAVRELVDSLPPLAHPRESRLPLFLWPAHQGAVDDVVLQERIIRALDQRGLALIATWKGGNQEDRINTAARIAEVQKKLGLMVCVNANDCMYGFYDGSKETAHVDDQGRAFFDDSIPGGEIGCPFRVAHKFEEQTSKIVRYVEAYQRRDLPIDLVFGDWEIDGPLEVNRAWESSQKCKICKKHLPAIDNFASFQDVVRSERARATRECYANPILGAFPNALVGNYGVYPNNGLRYWFDYFEVFYEKHPHEWDQRAAYRRWVDDFSQTGYTLAMPVTYTWSRIFASYDFDNPDYRWFYNMLLVGSNACEHTEADVPVVPFVHWHTVFESGTVDPDVVQMTRWAYQELLWHLLLRGADSFFLWCTPDEALGESVLVHEVWRDALKYREWLESGTPISFDVPSQQGPVISGLRMGNRVLVRRTDFGDAKAPIDLSIGGKTIRVPVDKNCQIISLTEK
ncbi:hypothetical protein OAS39_01345 [Pirellulales bacterium]|nr:hypothetical protein [Pirellulales bacterium]